MKCKGVDVTGFEAAGDGKSDNADAFERAVSSLQRTRYGTIHVPDGVFEVSRPIRLGHSMSLNMAPSARILASQDFEGPAVVLKGEDGKPDGLGDDHSYHDYGGQICGGIIDAGGNEILGISIPWGCRYSIHDIEVHNARAGGIHLGEEGWYEATLRSVRIALDFDCPHMPGSVGLKIERVSDSHVSQVLVIGYETGVHATASSTGFHQVHVWNGANRPLKCAFNAAGWHDMYSQCQADAYDGTAFYVNAPFQRFIGNFMQTHDRYSTPEDLAGFEVGPAGTHCTYLGNFHNARENVPIQEAYKGSMEGATVLGNLYTEHVRGGKQNRIPSDTGGKSYIPPLEIAGDKINIGSASPEPPSDEEGKPGEIRWCETNGECTLYLRTETAWQKTQMEKA